MRPLFPEFMDPVLYGLIQTETWKIWKLISLLLKDNKQHEDFASGMLLHVASVLTGKSLSPTCKI